jgi:hypothetical protein
MLERGNIASKERSGERHAAKRSPRLCGAGRALLHGLGRSLSMRARLLAIAVLSALALLPLPRVLAQEAFPGTSYITPFPTGDIYRVQVYGDAFAEGLLGGLVDSFTDDTLVQLQKKRRPLSGLTRFEFDDELKAEDANRDTVHIAVVMIGYNERYHIRTSVRERTEFGTAEWRAEYGRRVDRLAKTLKKRGMAVYWVGLPIMRRPDLNETAQMVNDIVRERAYLNGIKYIDITAQFADEGGNYTPYGPDVAGKQRLVRDVDGVLFTWVGYRKLAHFVEREIKRDLTQARSERAIPLAGSEAEQKRIAALRPRPPEADAGWKGSIAATKDGTGKEAAKGQPKTATPPGPAATAGPQQQPSAGDVPGEPKADNGRIMLKTIAAGGREETVTLELPRPAIPAAVLQLITRKDTGDRPSPMGDALADDVGGGLVVLSSVTPLGTGPGLPRKAVPGQPYYQVWFKGERLPPRPGRSDDFTWPRVDPEIVIEQMPTRPPRPGLPKTPPRS